VALADAGCTWNAAADAPWIAIIAGASGTAMGEITYTVPANPYAARRGNLVVHLGDASMSLVVLQDGQ
jgi:hypothetical protein